MKEQNTDTRVDGVPSDRPLGSTASDNEVKCSFCQRSEKVVLCMMVAPSPRQDVAICAACVTIGVQAMLQNAAENFIPNRILKRYSFEMREIVDEPPTAAAVDPIPASSVDPSTREKSSAPFPECGPSPAPAPETK